MKRPLVTDELWEAIEPLLPVEPPKPKGGRPRIEDRAALTGIIFVLKSGIPWEMLPQEMGCGSRRLRAALTGRRFAPWHDVLAETTGLARSRRMGEPGPGTQRPAGRTRPDRLGASEPGQCECPGKKGGAQTGPNPTDRGNAQRAPAQSAILWSTARVYRSMW